MGGGSVESLDLISFSKLFQALQSQPPLGYVVRKNSVRCTLLLVRLKEINKVPKYLAGTGLHSLYYVEVGRGEGKI